MEGLDVLVFVGALEGHPVEDFRGEELLRLREEARVGEEALVFERAGDAFEIVDALELPTGGDDLGDEGLLVGILGGEGGFEGLGEFEEGLGVLHGKDLELVGGEAMAGGVEGGAGAAVGGLAAAGEQAVALAGGDAPGVLGRGRVHIFHCIFHGLEVAGEGAKTNHGVGRRRGKWLRAGEMELVRFL